MVSFTVAAGIAVALAAVYFFSSFGKSKPKSKVRSVEVGTAKSGESKPRRAPKSKDKLYVPSDATLYDLLKHTAARCKNNPAAGTRTVLSMVEEEKVIKGETKKWQFPQLSAYKWITYGELFQKINNVGSGLANLGLKKGDVLAIFEDTRLEWTVTAHAAFSHSIVVATIYANLGEEGLQFALQEGDVNVLLTNGKSLASIQKIYSQTPKLKTIIYTDEADPKAKEALEKSGVSLISFSQVEKRGAENPATPELPQRNDLAIIMYTSGSTGNPKGVMITHQNILSVVGAVVETVHLQSEDVYISYLPLAHVLALACETAMIKVGASFGYANPRFLLDAAVRNCKGDLRELRPTLMAGVPTIWDRVRKGALQKVEHGSPVLKFIFKHAFNYKSRALLAGQSTPLVDKVFQKFKETLGGRIRLMVSGGAPLSKDTHEFLRVCFGVPVLQGYGLTETCGGATLQETDDISYGVAGSPVICSEIKLVDVPDMGYVSSSNPPRGEVWISGGNIALGYFKNEEKTKEDFKDGWFATGDVGQWNPDGTLSIIDRKKNLVKLSHGEYIALERLESIYKGASLVESICVHGNSQKPFPIAIVHPSKPALTHWAEANGLDAHDWEGLCHNKKAEAEVLSSITAVARKSQLKSFEVVKAVILSAEEWLPENGLMTAAMKLKRQAIEEKFKKEIAEKLATIDE
eukprot:TRINITY_DN9638_c0_g1_i1.p1 TRINITY_DN9638_c0_g1~~TRINITY_DN9638_c0_g1_i1.p1  ORF type:complete len:691 (-),score=170.11 TRINITY_DN9638_c0_g1_i1:120-2192(-)